MVAARHRGKDVEVREPVETLYREINELVEQHEKALVRYGQSITRDADKARDIIQDTFLKYLDRRKSGEEIKNVKAWLYRVVYNKSVDEVRKRQRHNSLEDHVRDNAIPKMEKRPDEILENKDDLEWLRSQLEQLGEKEKGVFKMKVYEEKSYREIATELDMSVGHVGIILHRVMKKLSRSRRMQEAGQGGENEEL